MRSAVPPTRLGLVLALTSTLLPSCLGGEDELSTPGVGPGPQPAGLFPTPSRTELLEGTALDVAAGDLDGDGRVDLSVLYTEPNVIGMVRLATVSGLADGSFSEPTFHEGTFGSFAATEDLNGDGRADLVTVETVVGEVLVSLRGNDGFADPVPYAVGSRPGRPVLADVNGDGAADVVVGHAQTFELATLLGRGDGTFDAARFTRLSFGADQVALGFLDDDPHLDAVAFNLREGASLLGNGDGTFGAPVTLMGSFTRVVGLQAADVTGDGNTDAVLVDGIRREVQVLEGDGLGSLTTGPVVTLSGSFFSLSDFALSDLDHDDDPDLVLGLGMSVQVLRNDGGTSFVPLPPFRVGQNLSAFVLLDQDDDGNTDLLGTGTGNFGFEAVTSLLVVLRGLGDGAFEAPCSYPLTRVPGPAVLADFDQDEVPDVLAVDRSDDVMVYLRGVGDGSFELPVATSIAPSTLALTAADVYENTLTDAVTASDDFATGSISLWASRGDGTFDPPTSFPSDGLSPVQVRVADLDGDLLQDLVVLNASSHKLGVHRGLGAGSFAEPVRQGLGLVPTDVELGDLNRDGLLDAAASNSGSSSVSVLLGSPDGLGTDVQYGVPLEIPSALELGDLDLDGNLDVLCVCSGIVTLSESSGLVLLRGQGDGTLVAGEPDLRIQPPVGLELSDLDGDGALDALVLETLARVSYFLGDGTGAFVEPVHVTLGGLPAGFLVGDVNGDEKPDILVSETGQTFPVEIPSSLTVFLNQR